jgi:hypothetical protein
VTTPTITEAEAIGRGWYAYRRVIRSEWPGGNGRDIAAAIEGVTDALETYMKLLADKIHPAVAYPELERDDNAYDKALAMSAQDAGDWAAELDRLVPVETERSEAA